MNDLQLWLVLGPPSGDNPSFLPWPVARIGVQPSLVSYGTAMLASNRLGRWEVRKTPQIAGFTKMLDQVAATTMYQRYI